jgi:hypothetical protein
VTSVSSAMITRNVRPNSTAGCMGMQHRKPIMPAAITPQRCCTTTEPAVQDGLVQAQTVPSPTRRSTVPPCAATRPLHGQHWNINTPPRRISQSRRSVREGRYMC